LSQPSGVSIGIVDLFSSVTPGSLSIDFTLADLQTLLFDATVHRDVGVRYFRGLAKMK
jgi:hypothetical protein